MNIKYNGRMMMVVAIVLHAHAVHNEWSLLGGLAAFFIGAGVAMMTLDWK